MSELEIYHCDEWHNPYTEFYLKSEADKVIAEKDKEIAELKEGAKKLILDNYLQTKELRHQKRKRCLAMAQVLEHVCPITNRKAKWREKWRECWLELAEKFKEAK